MVDRVIRVVLDSREAEANSNRLRRGLTDVGDVGERSTRRINRGLGGVSRTADGLRRTLAGAFALTGVTLGVQGLTQLADSYTQIQNRLRVVTRGQGELEAATQKVFDISQRTRGSFQATAELYSRVSLAARDLGISQQQTAEFTESLNQAVILSGASTTEASAGLIQLSQGLASGTLRGDELRSVLEQLPVVADVIAESLEVTRGELRLLGAEGLISAEDIIRAFDEAKDTLEQDFGKTVPTLAQSFELLRGQIIRTFGQFNQAAGTTTGLASAIIFLRDGVADLTPGLIQLNRAVQGNLDPSEELSINMEALAKTLLGVLTVGEILADSLVTTVRGAFRSVGTVIGGVSAAIAQALTGNFSGAKAIIGQLVDDIAQDTVQTTRDLNERITEDFINLFERVGEIDTPQIRTPSVQQPEVVDNGENIRQQVIAQRRLASATEARNEVFTGTLSLLEQEAQILRTSGTQRDLLLAQLDLEDEIREALGDKVKNLTEDQVAALTTLSAAELRQIEVALQTNASLERRAEILEEIRGPQDDLIQRQQDLNDLLSDSTLTTQEATTAIQDLALEQAQLNFELGNASFEDGFILALENMMEAARNFQGEAGALFGSVFEQVSAGFADAAANALLFGDSFKEAFGNVARQAVQQIVSGLIQLGVQFVINSALAKTGIATTAAAQNTANASIAASAAPAAATTSLASFGANAAPAIAGILAVAAIAASLGAFETGGDFKVGGSGGRDSQLVAFRASPDETISVRTPQQRDREDNRLGSSGGSSPAESSPNTIINVVDPSMIEDALASASGQQVLVNVIQRNSSAINGALS